MRYRLHGLAAWQAFWEAIMTLSRLIQLAATGVAVYTFSVLPVAAQDDGGPDYYEVVDVSKGKHLNIRTRPSLKATVLGGAATGTKLKNLGCKDGDGGRWCNIETEAGLKGYSFGRYLREAPGVAADAAPPPPAKPARFAVGTLKCERNNGSPVVDCAYGVLRLSPTMSRVQITWPDATKRMFGIYGGAASSADGPVVAKVGADGSYDLKLTPKGAPTEHYVVSADIIAPK
jgi:Bacterial SH3 domain